MLIVDKRKNTNIEVSFNNEKSAFSYVNSKMYKSKRHYELNTVL